MGIDIVQAIIKGYIPAGRNNRPAIYMTPKWVTIHDTANTNPGADAEGHAAYLKGDAAAKRPASWHFTVDGGSKDKDGVIKAPQIYQHLPLDETGWHAGDWNGPGNMQSVGVEICENMDGDRAVAEDMAAQLVAWLLQELRLDISKVVQHHHWSGKDCPRVLRSRPGGWEGFLAAVEKYKTGSEHMFKDINEAWYPSIIQQAAELGLVAGYPDGTIRPKELVTFERFIYVLMRYRNRDIHQDTIVDLVNRWKRSVVLIRNDKQDGGSSLGSGSFISDDGLILTNRHVTENNKKLTITWFGGAQYSAKLVRDSVEADLALVKVDGIKTNPVQLADTMPRHGDFCMVFGAPLALKDSATFGIVSYPDRDAGHFVQVDAAINPGNSGGACFDLRGKFIGVPTLKFVGPTVDNVAYLTSVPEINKFLEGR